MFRPAGAGLEVVTRALGRANTRTTEESYAELLDETIRAGALAAILRDEKIVVERRGERHGAPLSVVLVGLAPT
jgi:hypothetical protein